MTTDQALVDGLLLPPGNLIVAGIIGIAVTFRRVRTGRWISLSAVAALYLLSVPLIAAFLMRTLETDPPWTNSDERRAQAIVVLSADTRQLAREYQQPTIGRFALERLRHAAWLHRRTGLPVITTGGPEQARATSRAQLMKQVLETDFHTNVRWIEETSRTTLENASEVAKILVTHEIRVVILVTHAWHMPRARLSFANAGIAVVPAPMGFRDPQQLSVASILPSADALLASKLVFHEWLGLLWYKCKLCLSRD